MGGLNPAERLTAESETLGANEVNSTTSIVENITTAEV